MAALSSSAKLKVNTTNNNDNNKSGGILMLSRDLEFTLSKAFKRARIQQHEYMTVEHLLIALLDNYSVMELLKSCEYCATASRVATVS